MIPFRRLVPVLALALPALAPAETEAETGRRLGEKLGAEGLERWQAETLPPPRLLPEAEWPFVAPENPPDREFFDMLEVRPAHRTVLRPIGVPWFLPGELGGAKNGDRPGPGMGIGLSWTPTPGIRFGADLVERADRVDADNRLHDWTTYFAPGVEYVVRPHVKNAFAIGVVFPWALAPRGDDHPGAFIFVRWNELFGVLPRPAR